MEDKFAYHPARQVCFGCQQKDLLREEEKGNQAGVSVILVKGPPPKPKTKAKKVGEG